MADILPNERTRQGSFAVNPRDINNALQEAATENRSKPLPSIEEIQNARTAQENLAARLNQKAHNQRPIARTDPESRFYNKQPEDFSKRELIDIALLASSSENPLDLDDAKQATRIIKRRVTKEGNGSWAAGNELKQAVIDKVFPGLKLGFKEGISKLKQMAEFYPTDYELDGNYAAMLSNEPESFAPDASQYLNAIASLDFSLESSFFMTKNEYTKELSADELETRAYNILNNVTKTLIAFVEASENTEKLPESRQIFANSSDRGSGQATGITPPVVRTEAPNSSAQTHSTWTTFIERSLPSSDQV